MNKLVAGILLSAAFLASVPVPVSANDLTSSNYKVIAPVVNPGAFSSSGNFRMFGAFNQPGTGISSSGNYQVKGGFLYFAAPAAAPAPTPTPSPTPGGGGGGPILEIYKKFIGILFPCAVKADLNCDGRVDIYDVGILMYWWQKPIKEPTFFAEITKAVGLGRPSPDLNADTGVDIFDLSILLTFWTG